MWSNRIEHEDAACVLQCAYYGCSSLDLASPTSGSSCWRRQRRRWRRSRRRRFQAAVAAQVAGAEAGDVTQDRQWKSEEGEDGCRRRRRRGHGVLLFPAVRRQAAHLLARQNCFYLALHCFRNSREFRSIEVLGALSLIVRRHGAAAVADLYRCWTIIELSSLFPCPQFCFCAKPCPHCWQWTVLLTMCAEETTQEY